MENKSWRGGGGVLKPVVAELVLRMKDYDRGRESIIDPRYTIYQWTQSPSKITLLVVVVGPPLGSLLSTKNDERQ